MSLPFFNNGFFGLDTGLALTVLLGFGFGFFLERAGFGSAKKLAAQFYLYDMTVFKVMFTAITTAMVGIWGLAKIGWLNIDLIWINPTFLWPQIVGGVILGLGFIISGYCPGTSLVASVSGKIDGMLTVLGVIIGILLFGFVYTPELAAFHTSGSMGRLTIAQVFGFDPMILSLIIAAVAAVCFIFAEWVEKTVRKDTDLDAGVVKTRLGYVLVGVVVVSAALFIISPSGLAPVKAESITPEKFGSLELARHIVEGRNNIVIYDLRQGELEKSIPGAVQLEAEKVSDPTFWTESVPVHKKVVLVASSSQEKVPEIRVPDSYRVFMLEGGFENWENTILTEPEKIVTEEDKERQALYAYFTGAATKAAPKVAAPAFKPKAGGKKKKVSGGC